MSATFGLLISVWFLSNPWFIRQIICFFCRYLSSVFHCFGKLRGKFPVDCLQSIYNDSVRAMRKLGGGGWGHAGGDFLRGCACKIILECDLLHQSEAHTRSQSGSWSRRGLGIWYLWIMWEYEPAFVIAIHLLTQPCTCERGSSGVFTTSRLKFVSTTSASSLSMTSTERKNGEKCFCCSWQWLSCLFFLNFSQQSRRLSIGSFL